MEPRQKRTRTKAKASNTLAAPIRRSSRVASRLGWRIPPEILLLIMNEIRNSVHSLKIATLVCRAWRGPAQFYLFSQMRIETPESCRRVAKILCKSSHIASHVSRLIVVEYDERALTPAYTFMKNDWLMGRQSPYLESKPATEIASRLCPTVRELGICVFPFCPGTVAFIKSLQRVQILKVDECEDVRVEDLMEAITGLLELTELHLFSGSFEPDPGEYESSRLTLDKAGTDDTTVDRETVTSPMRITRLVLEKLEHRFDLMKFFLDRRYFDLENLKDLILVWMRVEDQICIPTLDYRYLDRLLERLGPTLKCLKLGLSGGGRRPRDRYLEHFTANPMTSPLQCLVAIEVFSVECKEPSFHGLSPSPHLALLRSLSTSSLTRVELALSLDVEDFPEVDEQYFTQPEENAAQHWKAVDCLLADESRFPVFQNLSISITLEYESSLASVPLDEYDVCGDPSCFACISAAAIVERERELMSRNGEEIVDGAARQLVEMFERVLSTLKGRDLIRVDVRKKDRSMPEPERYGFEQWKD